jgi:hypothetical protein
MFGLGMSMAMQQEPIDWRYLPNTKPMNFRPIFIGNIMEYPHNSSGLKNVTVPVPP